MSIFFMRAFFIKSNQNSFYCRLSFLRRRTTGGQAGNDNSSRNVEHLKQSQSNNPLPVTLTQLAYRQAGKGLDRFNHRRWFVPHHDDTERYRYSLRLHDKTAVKPLSI
jgi:hypothetical protein